jgi:hypothetical protein
MEFLQNREDFYINYKEFLNWFFVKNVFEHMRVQGTTFQTNINYVIFI